MSASEKILILENRITILESQVGQLIAALTGKIRLQRVYEALHKENRIWKGKLLFEYKDIQNETLPDSYYIETEYEPIPGQLPTIMTRYIENGLEIIAAIAD